MKTVYTCISKLLYQLINSEQCETWAMEDGAVVGGGGGGHAVTKYLLGNSVGVKMV